MEEFLCYVEDFDRNPNTRPALPFLIGHEVFGVKFALACDFLKEIGFSNYSKPDTHLLDIFTGLGLSDRDPLSVFRAVTEMSVDVQETPYAVDKVFWLIGSGNLYNHARTFHTDKDEYVRMALSAWEEKRRAKYAPGGALLNASKRAGILAWFRGVGSLSCGSWSMGDHCPT
ncbi:MAG: hypothetical protein A2Y76_03545 [Planctomycetes bacterium RBG_13_60_9]|nr:MAG: hypothetical protein A2Y76_03545 [Planctomycetes bacterium RBG_13_60_9]